MSGPSMSITQRFHCIHDNMSPSLSVGTRNYFKERLCVEASHFPSLSVCHVPVSDTVVKPVAPFPSWYDSLCECECLSSVAGCIRLHSSSFETS